jgi:hypothetical protein
MTSTTEGALGGWIETLNFFKIEKSDMELLKICFVLFPDKETLEQIIEIEFFQ